MKFTPSQQAAIAHVQGNLQLIACAGSGKTEVVAQRVVNLLQPAAEGRRRAASLRTSSRSRSRTRRRRN